MRKYILRAKEVYSQLTYQSEEISFWRWWVWLGSFGLGVAVFLHLLQSIRFGYHSYKNAVGYPAFTLYPEHQEFYFYLIALAVIPIFTFLGYALWRGFLLLQRRWLSPPQESYLGLSALSFSIWWLPPLTYLLGPEWQFISFLGAAGAFLGVNFGLMFYGFWRKDLPSPAFHLSIGALGSSLGIFLLTTPHLDPSQLNPFSVLLGTAAFGWFSWMVFSWYLARLSGCSFDSVARSVAIVYLPLALLALQPVLWLEVRQEGQKLEAAGYAFPYGTEILLLAVLIGMAGAALFAFRKVGLPSGRDFFKKAFLWGAFPLLIYGLAYLPNIHFSNFYYSYGIELFHEGEKSAPANAILRGQKPYKEVFFIHGLIRNGLSSILAFKLFGLTIRGMRFLIHLIAPLGLISVYYFSLACLPVEWALFTAFFWLIWFPGGYIIGSQGCDRIIWVYLSLCFLIFYLRKGAAWLIILAAVLGAIAFIYTVESGLTVIPASLGMLACQAIFSRGWGRLKPLALYLAGLGIGFLPLFLYLLRIDGLSAFWNTHLELLKVNPEMGGLPWEVKFLSLAYLAILAGTIVYLLRVISSRKWTKEHYILLLLLFENIIYYNYVLIRTDKFHLYFSLPHILPTLLLLSYIELKKSQRYLWSISALLTMSLLLPLSASYNKSLPKVLAELPSKNRLTVSAELVMPDIPRLGNLLLPAGEAETVKEVVDFLTRETRPEERIWDLSGQGALYFLADRLSPTRFYDAWYVATAEAQREVIQALRTYNVKYVIFRSGGWMDAPDKVDKCLRNYLIAEFLFRHYHPLPPWRGVVILKAGEVSTIPPERRPAIFGRMDWGHVPLLWGEERAKEFTERGKAIAAWEFAGKKGAGWLPSHSDIEFIAKESGLEIKSKGERPSLEYGGLNLEPEAITYLELKMKINPVQGEEKAPLYGQIFWSASDQSYGEERSVVFAVKADGLPHTYFIRLASLPNWMWHGEVEKLRIEPLNVPGEVEIERIRLIYLDEIQG